jgi:hypothetical protein
MVTGYRRLRSQQVERQNTLRSLQDRVGVITSANLWNLTFEYLSHHCTHRGAPLSLIVCT